MIFEPYMWAILSSISITISVMLAGLYISIREKEPFAFLLFLLLDGLLGVVLSEMLSSFAWRGRVQEEIKPSFICRSENNLFVEYFSENEKGCNYLVTNRYDLMNANISNIYITLDWRVNAYSNLVKSVDSIVIKDLK